MVVARLEGQEMRQSRAQLLARPDLSGRSLARRLARLADAWFDRLAYDLPAGWSLMATGGYAGGALCPGSDIDVVLMHPPKATAEQVRRVAEGIWYPLWDASVKLSPAAHSIKSLLALANDDLVTATSILRVRTLAGDAEQVKEVQRAALDQWRRRSSQWLHRLHEVSEERWAKTGEIASLLEPDLKDGIGGLRDHDVLRWALATDREDVRNALESPMDELAAPAEMLLTVRCELHRVTGRNMNVLLLEDQDAVAEAMGFADADVFMRRVAGAARAIDWASARFWRRVERSLNRTQVGRRATRAARADPRRAHRRRRGRRRPDRRLQRPVAGVPRRRQRGPPRRAAQPPRPAHAVGERRPARASSGPSAPVGVHRPARLRRWMVATVEALEQYDLFSLFLPEWRHVRSLPQRNAFHVYTVDRHLLHDGGQRHRVGPRGRPPGPAARRRAAARHRQGLSG